MNTAPEWAVNLVNKLNIVDNATEIVNAAVTGKTKEEAKTQERNRMIKLLSIASGKTTAEQEAEAGDIPYSQYIKQKKTEQKENTADNDGEVEVSENGIYAGMSEEERYEVLKNQTVVPVESENMDITEEDNIQYEDLIKKAKSKIEHNLIEKIKSLGIIKGYTSKAIKPKFDFTVKGLRKSLHSQLHYGGNYLDFTKVLNNLQKLLDNAVLIETHTDKAVGTEYENRQLKQVYVMVSALKDGDSIIPVQFEVKQHIDDDNKLYVAVALTKTETGVTGNTILDKNQASTSLIPVSNISLHDLFENINPKDADFLKYVPDGFLNKEQKQAKERALEEERVKYGKKNTDVTPSEEGYTSSTASGPPSPQGEGADIEISEADKKKQAERKEKVKSLCDLFGLSLEWDEGIKRGKYDPDTRTVFINPNLTLTEMYIEVLKHEFTHDLENRRLYKGFKEFLFGKSINFRDYCETALNNDYGEELKGDEAIKRLTQLKYRDYMSSDEMSDEEKAAFDNEAAEREIVADFVANRLLGGIGADGNFEQEAYETLKELSEYHRSGFQRFVDWIRELINKIKGQPTFKDMADELEYLNSQIAKVYDSKVNITETSGTEKYSIKVTRNMNWDEQLTGVEDKSLNGSNALYIGEYDSLKLFGLDNHPLAMNQGDYRKSRRKSGNNKHYSSHSVPLKFFKNIKEHINNSCMLIDNGEKATLVTDYIMSDTQGLPSLVILGINRNETINNDYVNKVISVYPLDDFKDRITKAAESDKLIIRNKSKANDILARIGIQPSERDKIINLAKDRLPQNSPTVKENSDNTDSHSIAVPFSEEFKADKRKRYAEVLVRKYGGNIDDAELENFLKEISTASDNNNYSEALKIAHKMAQYISENSAKGIQKTVNKNKIKEISNNFFTQNRVIKNRTQLEDKLSKALDLIMQSKTFYRYHEYNCGYYKTYNKSYATTEC